VFEKILGITNTDFIIRNLYKHCY